MIKKSYKFMAIILVLTMVLSILSGCAKSEDPAPVDGDNDSSEVTGLDGDKDFQISFGGSAPGGVFYYMIGVLANLVTEQVDKLNVTNVSTGAAKANAIGVGQGELHMGLTYGALAYELWNGTGVFEGQSEIGKNVQGVAKAYSSPHYFVALEGSGIESISDLEGKTVSVGPPGSGAAYNSELILDALDIGYNSVALAFADSSAALKEGRINAFGQSGAPSGAVAELSETENIVIIPFTDAEMDKLEDASQFYARNTLPKDTYKGMTEDVQMPFFDVYWVTNKDVPNDVVEAMTRTAFENKIKLTDGHILWDQLEEDTETFEKLGPKVHEGAKKYFEAN